MIRRIRRIERAVEDEFPGAAVEVEEARSGSGEIVLHIFTGHTELSRGRVRKMTEEELAR